MTKDGARNGQAGGHEHSGPNHAMETRDVFAHEVVLHGPTALEFPLALGVSVADARKVCQQRVSPHVAHVTFVEGQRDAPVEGGTANGKVLQAALDEGDDFIFAGLGTDELGMSPRRISAAAPGIQKA